MADYNESHFVASGGDRIRGRGGQKEKDCDREARALLRETKQEKERKKKSESDDRPPPWKTWLCAGRATAVRKVGLMLQSQGESNCAKPS